jgi:hypothetical protein
MRKLLWMFKIRKRISKTLANAVREQAYFESEKVRLIHAGRQDIGNYLGSRVEMKRELAETLRNLLSE